MLPTGFILVLGTEEIFNIIANALNPIFFLWESQFLTSLCKNGKFSNTDMHPERARWHPSKWSLAWLLQ
jgi:hypothetical protein